MGQASKVREKRRKARKEFQELLQNGHNVLVVHYSCESFYNRPQGTSPRITSLAVRNYETGQTTSFSIHQIAERHGLSVEEIDARYDEFEREMLSEFNDFARAHQGFKWLHWNMRDVNYGFSAIEHRFRVLGGDPFHIPEANLFDLSRIFVSLYGISYIGHPRLPKLIEKNKIASRDFLTGQQEADAFDAKEYVKLHQSTLRKVDVLANIAGRAWDGTLATDATWKELYGTGPAAWAEYVSEHPIVLAVGLIIGIVGSIFTIFGLKIDLPAHTTATPAVASPTSTGMPSKK